MLKVVKVRLYPNKKQQQLIYKTFGSCRYMYNVLHDAKIKAYECGDSLSAYELKKRLVPMKKAKGGEFLKEIDSTALQNSVLKIDVAYKNFFRRVKQGGAVGFAKFKSKHNSYQSYQTSTASIKENKLFLVPIVPDGNAYYNSKKQKLRYTLPSWSLGASEKPNYKS
jgi:putative transposase